MVLNLLIDELFKRIWLKHKVGPTIFAFAIPVAVSVTVGPNTLLLMKVEVVSASLSQTGSWFHSKGAW